MSEAAIADSGARGKVGPRADRNVGNTQAGEGPTNPSLIRVFHRTKQCAARIVNSLGRRRQTRSGRRPPRKHCELQTSKLIRHLRVWAAVSHVFNLLSTAKIKLQKKCSEEVQLLRLCKLASLTFSTDTVHTAVLVSTTRLDESWAIFAVGAHDRSIFITALRRWLEVNNRLTHELNKNCKHHCRKNGY